MSDKKCDFKEATKQHLLYKKSNENKENDGFANNACAADDQHPLRELCPKGRYIRKIKHDFQRGKHLLKGGIALQKARMQSNEQELDELKNHLNKMFVEEAEVKRKRWCRYCEGEATYLSVHGRYFYCSIECEQYHQNLLGTLREGLKLKLEMPAEDSSLFP